MSIKKLLLGAAVATVAFAVVGGVATAGSARMSKGDAQAVFEAFGNGGFAVLLHSKTVEGAPAQNRPGEAAIRPFAGSGYDGAHYCALDWHTILIADIEGGDKTFKEADAKATIASLDVSFTLDGNPLSTSGTTVKRFLNPARFGLDVAYYEQFGRVMAPSDLAVGAHTAGYTIAIDGSVVDTSAITFFVDPAGTGACL